MKKWNYQLVVQFDASTLPEYDYLVAFESRLIEGLQKQGIVDGHDFGRSEFNIFILTNSPKETFTAIEALMQLHLDKFVPTAVAYRELAGEQYTVLYPSGATSFNIS